MKHAILNALVAFLGLAIGCAGFSSASFAADYIVTLFPFAPPSVNITSANGSAVSLARIKVDPLNNYAGTVHFTCVVSGGRSPLPSCPNPPAVRVSPGHSGFSLMTVTAFRATPMATYTFTLRAVDDSGRAPAGGLFIENLDVMHHFGAAGGGNIALFTFLGIAGLWALVQFRRAHTG